MTHPLDNPIWNALATEHSHLAIGEGDVRRYDPDVAPFVAAISETAVGGAGPLIAAGKVSALRSRTPVDAIEGIELPPARQLEQWFAPGEVPAVPLTVSVEPLRKEDVPEMLELVALTRPGPFLPRTIEMGRYFGVREAGRLIAMAGERMRMPGYVEVSAVCTHPDARGRGLARQLVSMLARDLIANGDTPFLHVFPENVAAKTLYAELGFVHRQTLHLYLFGMPGL